MGAPERVSGSMLRAWTWCEGAVVDLSFVICWKGARWGRKEETKRMARRAETVRRRRR